MASGHIQTNKQIRRQFQQGLQMLLDTFHDTILLYTQDIHVVNFSDIPRGFVNVIIMYKNVEGRSVKLEATSNRLGQDRAGQIWLLGTFKLINGYVGNSNGDCKCYKILFMILYCYIPKIFML